MKAWVLLLFLILIEGVCAEIIIDDLEEAYNVGDEINLSFSIQKQEDFSDYVECYLDCNEGILVHKGYYFLEKNKKKDFETSFPSKESGNCSIDVFFGGEEEKSSDFEISDKINVEFNLNNKLFFPEETIIINGTAVKKNKELLEGFVDVSIEGLANRTIEVGGGEFFSSFKIEKWALPGKYDIRAEAFEKNKDEEVINQGISIKEIEIKSKPSNISISAVESMKPAFDFSAKISLLDQAQNELKNESINVKLFNPRGELVEKDVKIESGESFEYSFPSNALRGMWRLQAYYGNIFSLKMINIEDNKQVDFNVVNEGGGSYLEIINIGNVPYVGNFYVSVSNSSFEKDVFVNLSLDLAEKVLEPLKYEGVYNLTSEKGEEIIDALLITGGVVSPVIQLTWKTYVAFFVILAFIIIFYFFIKRRKKFGFFKPKQEKSAFMIFLNFDKYVEIGDMVEKEGFSLSRISDNLCYILFYGHHKKNPELSAYNLSRKIRNKFLSKMQGVSIVINSGKFYDKERFLKELSLTSRKMVNHADGRILVSEEILNKLNLRARKSVTFRDKEKNIKMYAL